MRKCWAEELAARNASQQRKLAPQTSLKWLETLWESQLFFHRDYKINKIRVDFGSTQIQPKCQVLVMPFGVTDTYHFSACKKLMKYYLLVWHWNCQNVTFWDALGNAERGSPR